LERGAILFFSRDVFSILTDDGFWKKIGSIMMCLFGVWGSKVQITPYFSKLYRGKENIYSTPVFDKID